MRNVIFHFHLFKNAGTSLDETLKKNFPGNEWVTKEFPANFEANKKLVRDWIVDNPQAKCFSSHTAFLQIPEIEGVNVIPVIFMRHPIDRIVSAYSFESKQGGDTFGAVLARNTTLSGYIETRLSIKGERQCRNFHTANFSKLYSGKDSDLNKSKKAVDELIFVGDVGNFNESISDLECILNDKGFIGISLEAVEKNVSRKSKTIEDKMNEIQLEIGDDLFNKLVEVNSDDLDLYSYFKEKYGFIN